MSRALTVALTADFSLDSEDLFGTSDTGHLMLLGMRKPPKPTNWISIGTLAARVAARLARCEEISALGANGAVTGPGNGNDTHPTDVADRSEMGEDHRLGFGEKVTPKRGGGRSFGAGNLGSQVPPALTLGTGDTHRCPCGGGVGEAMSRVVVGTPHDVASPFFAKRAITASDRSRQNGYCSRRRGVTLQA